MRYFKERNIRFQSIDLKRYGMSKGEFNSIKAAVGDINELIDYKIEEAALLKYLAQESAKEEKLLENSLLFKTPIVRNGRLATVGYKPEIWKTWE